MEKGIAKNIEFTAYHDLHSRAGFHMAVQVVDWRGYLDFTHFWHQSLHILKCIV